MTSFSVHFCSTLVPRHPLRRTRLGFRGMPEQLRQVIERVGLVQFAGMDQAHEQIAHPRPVRRLIEERVLAVQNRLLQSAFGDVMPPPGLCRVGRLLFIPSSVSLLMDAA
jgi:hypothetical protein